MSDSNGPSKHGDGGLDLRTTVSLLPTPTVQQGRNATSGRQPDAVFNTGTTLNDWAWEISDYLPTPAARDHKDSLNTRHAVTGKADYLPRAIGEMITDANL